MVSKIHNKGLCVNLKGITQMTAVEVVEKEIEKLSLKELDEFRLWFMKYDSDAWDMQIEADAAAGKLDALAKEAIAEYESGKAREI
jgi:hypothetical protein